IKVVNHWANELTFMDDKTRTRRDNKKYLVLIRSIALLHQYQREIKRGTDGQGRSKQYIEVEIEDIELANELANEVLGRTLDELPPQTRKLLMKIEQMVREACERKKIEQSEYRFMRRELRQYAGWSDTQLRIHLERLVAMEYVLVHRGGRGQSFVYELIYEGQGKDGSPFMLGLIEVEKLRARQKQIGV
ncbi:MAG: DNA primase, partial [Terriglobia bacterium]